MESQARDESFLNFYDRVCDSAAIVDCASHEQSDRYASILRGFTPDVGVLDGRNTPAQQARLAADFRADNFHYLLLGLRCAQSFSFQHCQHMWFGSLGHSAHTFWQAVGRVWRVNSPGPVTVTVPWESGSIDERTFGILASKLAIEGAALPPGARSSERISWNFSGCTDDWHLTGART